MDLKRIVRHLSTPPWRVHRSFPNAALQAIEQAVRDSEQQHTGQICVAIEGALDALPLLRGQQARTRAVEVFSQLRVWDTADNNGVLIYLLLADHDVEIVADRGIHQRVGAAGWEQVCQSMETQLRTGDLSGGVLTGIRSVGAYLAEHFPLRPGVLRPDSLSDRPTIL